MQFDFNVPDLGNLQPITMQRKARLGIGKRVIAMELGKTRITYIFAFPNPPEEVLKRPFNSS